MNEEKIMKKLEEHDGHFGQIFCILKRHDDQFDKIFAILKGHDDKFVQVFSKLEAHDDQLKDHSSQLTHLTATQDKILLKLVEHDEILAQTVKKDEFDTAMNRIFSTFDEILTILKPIDVERYATRAGMERMGTNIEQTNMVVENHEERIQVLELKV